MSITKSVAISQASIWILALSLTHPCLGVEFDVGEVEGSVDFTLQYGQSFRVDEADPSLYGRGEVASVANSLTAGEQFSSNADEGNLNFAGAQRFSNIARFNVEFDASWRSFGVFARGRGFYDAETASGFTDRLDPGTAGRARGSSTFTKLSEPARDLVTNQTQLLDAYAFAQFDVMSMPAEIRVGEQVVSWGESTFIQNGINIINPFDVAALRTPGAQIREALLPVGMVWGQIAPTDNLSLEAYYQYDWEQTRPEPVGSYFSTNDFVGDGGNTVFLGFGVFSSLGTVIPGLVNDPTFLGVPRASNRDPGDGQFGVALRWYSTSLFDTEFGFFYSRYHSRLPIISAVTGTDAGVAGAAAAGLGCIAGGLTLAGACALDSYAKTANYFIEYPEDIDLFGLSFNTQLGTTGIALQGEYSLKQDAPLQVDDVELLFAALTPLNSPLLGPFQASLGAPAAINQVGSFGTNTEIPGFIERDVSQFQVTATRIFGPIWKADQSVLVAEFGLTHVHNMPSRDTLRLNGPATFVTGNEFHSTAAGLHAGDPAESADAFASATSYGYVIAGRSQFLGALGPINLTPRFAFSHDVSGITPGPGGPFLEDRKALTLGLGGDYLNSWQADLSYTNFFGAGRHNLLHDRDFVAFNVRYAF